MSEKKQVTKNLLVNIVSMASRLLVGLWLAPYLVSHIGFAAYGFVPIAAILTEYVAIITNSINQAISRFLIIDIQKEDWGEANRTFNTSFFSNLALAAAQIPLFALILYNISFVIDIPDSLLDDVVLLCSFSMAAFLVSVTVSVFSASMFARNRLDLMRLTDIAGFGIRVTTIVVAFSVDTPKLYYVGLGELLASVSCFFVYYRYWRKLTPSLHIAFHDFDKLRLKSILTMSGWLIVNYVGFLLFLKIDIYVVNRFISPEQAGKYASVLQWSNLVRTIATVVSVLVSPLVLAAYAKKDFERLRFLLITAMKFLGAVVAIITGIVIVQSESLLRVWIGDEVAGLYPLMILLVIHLPINLSVIPLFSAASAYNKVKIPGIVTLISGIANVLLAIFFVVYTKLGVYGVAVAGLIVLTLKNAAFTSIYTSRFMQVGARTYVEPILRAVAATVIVFVVSLPIRLFAIDSWVKLLLSSSIAGLAALPVIWFVVFNGKDRTFIMNLLPVSVRNTLSKVFKLGGSA